MNGPHANMPQVQELIHTYVRENIVAIKAREEGAADAVIAYAAKVTKEGLMQCGVSEEIAERKCHAVSGDMLQYELFNAWLGDV